MWWVCIILYSAWLIPDGERSASDEDRENFNTHNGKFKEENNPLIFFDVILGLVQFTNKVRLRILGTQLPFRMPRRWGLGIPVQLWTPIEFHTAIIIYSFNSNFWSSEWTETSKYLKFLKITPKERGIACSSRGVFHRGRALNNSTRSYLQNKKGLVKKYFFWKKLRIFKNHKILKNLKNFEIFENIDFDKF